MTKTSRRRLLLSGLAATLTAAGVAARWRARPPVFGGAAQARAVEELLRDPAAARAGSLKILTWNVWMMPQWLRDSPRNEPRAAAIAAVLLEHDFDILCLEKMFDGGARAVLQSALRARYPHQFGPANSGLSVEVNSGVCVYSRLPLVNYAEIELTDCSSIECLSRKGAILLTGAVGGRPFHLVATHLQGEEGEGFTAKNDRVRRRQVEQIAEQLVRPNLAPAIPFFLCGDFNTRRHDGASPVETEEYRHLLTTLGAQNDAEQRITWDDSGENQLSTSHTGIRAELDYILTRWDEGALQVKRTVHPFRRSGWDGPEDRRDLSYRHAVSAEIVIPGR